MPVSDVVGEGLAYLQPISQTRNDTLKNDDEEALVSVPVTDEEVVIWCTSIEDFDLTSLDRSEPPSLCILHLETVFKTIQSTSVVRCLSLDEYERVMKYHFKEDKKRALVSLLLQKALIRDEFNLAHNEFEIHRTKEVCVPISLFTN